MARKFLCVYYDQEEAWTQLGDGEAGRLLKALIAYAKRGEEPALTGAERSAWAFLKVQVDANNDSYDAKVSKCREAGKASAAKRQQVSTDVNERQRVSTNKNNNKNKNKNKNNNDIGSSGRFAPPTLDEVRAYVTEKGLSVDPVKFFDYFTEGNWIDSKGNPVRNWKQKILTWDNKEPAPAQPKKKQYTPQADYVPPKPKMTIEQINALVDKI